MPTQEEIYEVLRTCYDPEIPVNIVDLGLVYDVQVAEQKVDIKMTLTARGCGMGGYIASEYPIALRANRAGRNEGAEGVQ